MSHPAPAGNSRASTTTSMKTIEQSPPARRSLIAALALASGAIVLIGSEIWLVAVLLYWAMVDFIGHGLVIQIAFGAVILVPALWATWKLVELAIAAERYPDPISGTDLSDA
jgi:cation transporter-like permease